MKNRYTPRVQTAPSKASSYSATLSKYKTYFTVGALVIVATVVLATLGGTGTFDSSSSSSEVIEEVVSSSSTGPSIGSSSITVTSVGSSTGSSSTGLSSSFGTSSSSSSTQTPTSILTSSSSSSSGTPPILVTSDLTFDATILGASDGASVSSLTSGSTTLTAIGTPPTIQTVSGVKLLQFQVGKSLSNNAFTYTNIVSFMILMYLPSALTVRHNNFMSTISQGNLVLYAINAGGTVGTDQGTMIQAYNNAVLAQSMITPSAPKWYMMVATFNGPASETKLYLNGVQVASGPCSNTGTYIGYTLNGIVNSGGSILSSTDSIYNFAVAKVWRATTLTQSEITDYKNYYENLYGITLN